MIFVMPGNSSFFLLESLVGQAAPCCDFFAVCSQDFREMLLIYKWMVTYGHSPSVLLKNSLDFHRMVYRNNADLGKGVPRQHVLHDTWELLFFGVWLPFRYAPAVTSEPLPASRYQPASPVLQVSPSALLQRSFMRRLETYRVTTHRVATHRVARTLQRIRSRCGSRIRSRIRSRNRSRNKLRIQERAQVRML
jgi:hypothetical protein